MAKRKSESLQSDLQSKKPALDRDFNQPPSQIPDFRKITPWTSSTIAKILPPLPRILDPVLEAAAFTHSGATKDPNVPSYERLEWVGDAYMELIATLLISSTFVSHPPGKCAQLRELLVKNETLAAYARQYGFEPRLNVPDELRSDPATKLKAKESVRIKVLGDVFEAYVAAIIQSDPTDGVDKVSQWLKSLWSMTIARQIQDEERRRKKEKEEAAESRFKPKDKLRRAIGCRGVSISYRDEAQTIGDDKLPIYWIGCYLENGLGEKNLWLGSGNAHGKSEAGQLAAEQALSNTSLMAILKAKKEAQVFEEEEAKLAAGTVAGAST